MPPAPSRRPAHPGLIRFFQVAAIAEAVSWAGLLLGMLFKYVVVGNSIGVLIFGPVHGFLVVAYAFSVLMAREELAWDGRTTILGLGASLPPFATLLFVRRTPH
jgi:integral membrane protein